ncbi:MAG: hypothetical protein AAF975_01395 [Spirochaetota bacterium]
MKTLFLLSGLLIWGTSCNTTQGFTAATGVYEKVYRHKTDLLLTELHYPVTNNSNLDGLLRERILKKYQTFRTWLNENSIELLNRKAEFTYTATFDALRSPDLRIMSFILYETWKVQGDTAGREKNFVLPSNTDKNIRGSTQTEVFMYSLKLDSEVQFFDVVMEPLLVFETLVESCLRQLNEYIGAGNFYSQGIQPDREHLKMLSFGKSGIQVSFPPGQVMSSDQGVIHVLVPWEEAIPDDPWQYGIIRSFRPPKYRVRPRDKNAETAGNKKES